MSDLHLRLNRDILTIAESARDALIKSGLDVDVDGALTLNVEPEVVEEAILGDILTGAQCVVCNVISFCPSALRKMNALKEAEKLARISVSMTKNKQIQHPLIRVFPSLLPLDDTSDKSMSENVSEYEFIAKTFNGLEFDGFLLHGFNNVSELKCALKGLRKATLKTIIYDKTPFENSNLEDKDYSPASSKIAIFDFSRMQHIDELLDTATKFATTKAQFLLVTNATPSKTAAISALTKGWSTKN